MKLFWGKKYIAFLTSDSNRHQLYTISNLFKAFSNLHDNFAFTKLKFSLKQNDLSTGPEHLSILRCFICTIQEIRYTRILDLMSNGVSTNIHDLTIISKDYARLFSSS